MKSTIMTPVIIVSYCVILYLTNLTLEHQAIRQIGITASSYKLRTWAAMFGIMASLTLAQRVWELLRSFLDEEIRIPRKVRLWRHWQYLLLLLPLGYGFDKQYSTVAEDGTIVTTIFTYGGSDSVLLILFSALPIMLFQILARLEFFYLQHRSEQTGR